jgi:DNA-directed RNA polymerase subunit RPC12/RpoP
MQILAKCPKCGQILPLSLEAADRRITCPKCFSLFKVPDIGHLEKALEVIKNAGGPIFVDQDGNVYG